MQVSAVRAAMAAWSRDTYSASPRWYRSARAEVVVQRGREPMGQSAVLVSVVAALLFAAATSPAVGSVLQVAASSASPVLYLLSKAGCSELEEFEYDDGGEFPGGQGAIACCSDTADALCISHNLTDGGHYNGAKLAGEFLTALGQARPTAFVLDVAAPHGAWLGWSVIDSTGQVFSAAIPDQVTTSPQPELRRVRLALDNETFAHHYGGAGNGLIHLPMVGIIIQSSGSPHTNTIGELRFANLSLEFASVVDIPSRAALTVSASTNMAGAVAQQSQGDLKLSLTVQNRLPYATVSHCRWSMP